MPYEKPSYRLFILWMLLFFVVLGGLAFGFSRFAPQVSEGAQVKTVLLTTLALLDGLFVLIYRTERVYWFTGVTYKDAARAGGERRRAYALTHLRRFGIISAVFAVYALSGFLLHTELLLDASVFLVLLIGAALSTLSVRL